MRYSEIMEVQLPVAKRSFKGITNNYGAFIVSMPPMTFLQLTTGGEDDIKKIIDSVTQNTKKYKANIPPADTAP